MIRRAAPAITLYLVMLLACVGLVAMPACGGNQRMKTIDAAALSLDTARDGFFSWALAHQLALVEKATTKAESDASVAAFVVKRDKVIEGIILAYQALLFAASKDDDKSLQDALAELADLVVKIEKLMTGGT